VEESAEPAVAAPSALSVRMPSDDGSDSIAAQPVLPLFRRREEAEQHARQMDKEPVRTAEAAGPSSSSSTGTTCFGGSKEPPAAGSGLADNVELLGPLGIPAGKWVIAKDIQSKPELNGKVCVIRNYVESTNRYGVNIIGTERIFGLKPENLTV